MMTPLAELRQKLLVRYASPPTPGGDDVEDAGGWTG